MAVDERVLIRKVGRALGVDKDSAVCVIGLIIKMIEVPEIIIGIGDGVIDLGIRGIYPADNIGVLRMQSRKTSGSIPSPTSAEGTGVGEVEVVFVNCWVRSV